MGEARTRTTLRWIRWWSSLRAAGLVRERAGRGGARLRDLRQMLNEWRMRFLVCFFVLVWLIVLSVDRGRCAGIISA